MRTQTKDRQITGDKHLGSRLLIFAALEIGAGMNCVLARPSGRAEECIEAVGICPLVSVRNDLAAQRPVSFARIRNPPFNDSRVKGHFKLAHKFFDLLRRELRRRTHSEQYGRWRCVRVMIATRGAICTSMWRTHCCSPSDKEWKLRRSFGKVGARIGLKSVSDQSVSNTVVILEIRSPR